MITLVILLFVVMLFLGAPLFLVISGLALFLFAQSGVPLMAVINEMYSLTDREIFVTLPLFAFAGIMMSRTRMPERLLNLTRSALGWFPGGLAIVTVFACAVITAFTGVTGVTIIAAGVLLYPALRKDNYSEHFSLGLLTSSGSLGLLLPPSIPLILFAIIAQIDPVRLFAAGLAPMLLMLLALSVYCVRKDPGMRKEKNKFSWKKLAAAFWDFKWELPVFIIIPLGIFMGVMTAVEAASVMAFYVLVTELFVLKEVGFREFPGVVKDAMTLVGSILIIIMASLATSNYFIQENVPMRLFGFLQQHIATRTGFLLTLNLFLLLLGCILDIFSSIMIVVPLLLPVARMYEIDLYHLGIIFLANMQIGYTTPPLGMNLFISSRCFNKPVLTLFKSTMPFIVILLSILMVITFVPELSLFFVGR